jgi:hypothetical protein
MTNLFGQSLSQRRRQVSGEFAARGLALWNFLPLFGIDGQLFARSALVERDAR